MDELVKRLREVADEVDNDYDVDPYNAEQRCLAILQAADAIEKLQNKLCDWCGVCPKERRRPSDCEIIYPNMQVPEVAIIQTEEGET